MTQTSSRTLKTFGAVAAAGLALAFSACGDDDSTTETSAAPETTATESTTSAADTGGSGGGGGTIEIAADPSAIAYTTGDLEASAGTNTIDFDNPSDIPHNVEIEDADGNIVGETEVISASKASADVDLEPGTYTYFCEVGDHRDEGMEGTLTVK